jgi:hypothetical protein
VLRSTAIAALVVLVASSAGAQGARWDRGPRIRHRDHRGAHLRIAGDYTLSQGETAHGPVVVIGGSADIDGHVDDDVVVIGGTVRLGPAAVIDGDLVTLGGTSTIDPAARVFGDQKRAHMTWPAITWPSLNWPRLPTNAWWSRALAVGGTVFRLGFTFIVGLLLTLVAPAWIGRLGRRVSESTGVSAIVGIGAEIGLGPAIVVISIALLISIIGIPLLLGVPLVLFLLCGLALGGFTAAAVRVGASIRGSDAEWTRVRAGDYVIGFVALTAVTIAGRVLLLAGPAWMGPLAALVTSAGVFIEYCAWTIGLGAAIGVLIEGRRQATVPPPIPPLPTAS